MASKTSKTMPEEISKYIHDFLRCSWEVHLNNLMKARFNWLKRNRSIGFKVGQIYKINEKLYTVIKVGNMITFECEGELIRRKLKFVKAHTCSWDDRADHLLYIPDNWIVSLDKRCDITIYHLDTP